MRFETPDDKAVYVREKFGKISRKYDLFNDLITLGLHRIWKKKVVAFALEKKPETLLDICCGTGDIARRAFRDSRGATSVTGGDFSREMLELAHLKEKEIDWLMEDACALSFDDESFEAVTVGFGLRNVKDMSAALAEIFRILKPGGKFVMLDMGKPENALVRIPFRFFFFRVVPLIGKMLLPGEDMFSYFPASTDNFPSQKETSRMILSAGFAKADIIDKSFGCVAIHNCEK